MIRILIERVLKNKEKHRELLACHYIKDGYKHDKMQLDSMINGIDQQGQNEEDENYEDNNHNIVVGEYTPNKVKAKMVQKQKEQL